MWWAGNSSVGGKGQGAVVWGAEYLVYFKVATF